MTRPDEVNERKVTDALRARLRYDRGLSRLRPVEHYQRIFAGLGDVVAREYAALEAEPAPGAPAAPAATGRPPGPEPAAAPEPPPSCDVVGPYRILRELGRGGQGTVHLAEDTRLARQVALKTLAPALVASSGMLDRFRREAAIASRLDHPGICTVYEAGEAGGIPYIAMRYVDGETLAARIAAARGVAPPESTGDVSGVTRASATGRTSVSTRPEVLALVAVGEKIARAMHAAHEAGLVHRDMKPANVIVGRDGEPVILDFGLAREEDGDGAGLTMTGALLGTPAYMSPEQLMAQRVRLDRRTDIYSLGVTLYETLTLRLPFEAPTREGLYQKILTTEAPNPRRYNAAIPNDLRVVLETAMEKDRDRRYLTALDFAEDLRRVRELQPIRARPVGRVARLGRWAQRNPALASAVGGLFVSLVAGLAVSVSLLHDARTERDDKVRALATSERERAAKEAALTRAEALRLAGQSGEALHTDPTLALLLALEAAKRQEGPAARAALAEALDRCYEVRTLEGHEGAVMGARFTRDGARIVSTSTDGTARVWDAEDGRTLLVIDAPAPFVSGPCVTPDDRRLAALTAAPALGIWDLATGRSVAQVPAKTGSYDHFQIRMSPDGAWIASRRLDGRPVLVSVADGSARELPVPEGSVGDWTVTEFSDDGALVAGCNWMVNAEGATFIGQADVVAVWRTRDAQLVWSVRGLNGQIGARPLRADPAGAKLVALRAEPGAPVAGSPAMRCGEFDVATGAWTPWPDTDATRRAWDVHGDVLISVPAGPDVYVGRASFASPPVKLPGQGNGSAAGARPMPGGGVLTWSTDGAARIWDAEKGTVTSTLVGAGTGVAEVTSVDVDAAGRRIVTARNTGESVRVWRAGRGGVPTIAMQGFATFWGARLTWSPDERLLVANGSPPTIVDVEARRARGAAGDAGVFASVVGFSASGDAVVAASADQVYAWSVEHGRKLWSFPCRSGRTRGVALAPDASRVHVALTDPAEFHAIDVADGTARRTEIPAEADAPVEIARAADLPRVQGKDFASVRLWDTGRGRMLPPIEATWGDLVLGPLGPDRFWTLAWDGQVVVRSHADGAVATTFPSESGVYSTNLDGSVAAVFETPTRVTLWDTRTPRRITTVPLAADDGPIASVVAVSPDGRRCAQFRRSDQTLRVWDVGTGEEVLTLRGAAGRAVDVAFSRSGDHIATLLPGGTVTVWPIDILAAARAAQPRELTIEERVRYLDRPEDRAAAELAAAAVAAAAEQTFVPAEARRLIRARTDLDGAARRAAMHALQLWPDEWTLIQRAWFVVMRGGDERTVRTAMRQTEAAVKMAPHIRNMRSARAGLLYRAGEYAQVIDLIGAPDPAPSRPEPMLRALELTFLAMSHHRLGHADAAAKAMDELRTLAKLPVAAQQTDVRVLMAEAERTLAGPPEPARPAPATPASK